MSWIVWRQGRTSLLICLTVVAVVAAGLLGLRLAATGSIAELGLTDCLTDAADGCPSGALAALDEQFGSIARLVPLVLLALPVLLGAFSGAPLFAREFEERTQVFSLTQGVSRHHWWLSKVAIGGVPLACAMLGLGLLTAWTLAPLSSLTSGRLTTPGFESQGPVLGAYFLLAFGIGATAGLLLRNTLAAIAVTLAAYLAVLVVLSNAARPHYLPAEHVSSPVQAGTNTATPTHALATDAWILNTTYTGADGTPVDFNGTVCAAISNITDCLIAQGVTTENIDYHAPGRFWAFQSIEGGLAAALSAAVLVLGAWHLRRRAT